MAKLSGWTYIVVGIFVSAVSYKVNYEKFIFFFYFGLLFAIIGVVRLGINFMKSKSPLEEEKAAEKPYGQSRHNYSPARTSQHPSQHHSVKYCQNCGNAAGIHDNFCSRCGARI